MTYREIIDSLRKRHDHGEAQAMTRFLGERLFGMSFADMLCGAFDQLSPSEEERLGYALTRIDRGEPIQYILGTETFCGRTFVVRPDVLIPRPETEELCQWIVAESCGRRILDVGTGSGAIAITLALEIPEAEVVAIDISGKALETARENAKRLNAKIVFRQGDCLLGAGLLESSQKPSETLESSGKPSEGFDIIVSNPPYIMEKEKAEMSQNVLENEPALALFVPDNNPLLFYKAIAEFATENLKPDGKLFFEINPLCTVQMESMLKEKGFTDVEIRKDQFGKERMLMATH